MLKLRCGHVQLGYGRNDLLELWFRGLRGGHGLFGMLALFCRTVHFDAGIEQLQHLCRGHLRGDSGRSILCKLCGRELHRSCWIFRFIGMCKLSGWFVRNDCGERLHKLPGRNLSKHAGSGFVHGMFCWHLLNDHGGTRFILLQLVLSRPVVGRCVGYVFELRSWYVFFGI